MDFASYADLALGLANLTPHGDPDRDTLAAFLHERWSWIDTELDDGDVVRLQQLHRDLRAVLTAEEEDAAVTGLNALLRRHPVSPEISDHRHGEEGPSFHLHLHRGDVDIAEHVAAVCAMGLTVELLDTGFDRRGSCHHTTCDDVFIDVSPGGTRRYCDDRCQNRANVAAYRARKRAEAAAGD